MIISITLSDQILFASKNSSRVKVSGKVDEKIFSEALPKICTLADQYAIEKCSEHVVKSLFIGGGWQDYGFNIDKDLKRDELIEFSIYSTIDVSKAVELAKWVSKCLLEVQRKHFDKEPTLMSDVYVTTEDSTLVATVLVTEGTSQEELDFVSALNAKPLPQEPKPA